MIYANSLSFFLSHTTIEYRCPHLVLNMAIFHFKFKINISKDLQRQPFIQKYLWSSFCQQRLQWHKGTKKDGTVDQLCAVIPNHTAEFSEQEKETEESGRKRKEALWRAGRISLQTVAWLRTPARCAQLFNTLSGVWSQCVSILISNPTTPGCEIHS